MAFRVIYILHHLPSPTPTNTALPRQKESYRRDTCTYLAVPAWTGDCPGSSWILSVGYLHEHKPQVIDRARTPRSRVQGRTPPSPPPPRCRSGEHECFRAVLRRLESEHTVHSMAWLGSEPLNAWRTYACRPFAALNRVGQRTWTVMWDHTMSMSNHSSAH